MWTPDAVKEVIRYFFTALGIFIVVMIVILSMLRVFIDWK